uniref:Uncharacterized protein n=1 Tax=Arundo donax TaxID=35708 RepID=A0A0A9B901_ARUDO
MKYVPSHILEKKSVASKSLHLWRRHCGLLRFLYIVLAGMSA